MCAAVEHDGVGFAHALCRIAERASDCKLHNLIIARTEHPLPRSHLVLAYRDSQQDLPSPVSQHTDPNNA
jgi:hypothetical protein